MTDTTDILLVYTTETNSTRQMADAVAGGVRSVAGAACEAICLIDGTEVDKDRVVACGGLIVGTPVRHRSMHHRVKRFIERTLEVAWLADEMVGRVGGSFSVGGGHGDAGAGAELCQLGILSAMAANGMVIVPLPKCTPGFDHAGMHWGPVGRSGGPRMQPLWLSDAMLACGRAHGANVARIAKILQPTRASLFERGNVAPSPELVAAFGGDAGPEERVPDAGANVAGRVKPPDSYPSGEL